jgi:hypothetical protein
VLASESSASSPLPPQNDNFMIDALLSSARRSPSAVADVHVNRHGSIDVRAAQRAAALDEIESVSKLAQRLATPRPI